MPGAAAIDADLQGDFELALRGLLGEGAPLSSSSIERLRGRDRGLGVAVAGESPFAAVRLRTDAGKRFKKVANATALIWRLLLVAERTFRRLDAPQLLPEVALGARYRNGIRIVDDTNPDNRQEAAA